MFRLLVATMAPLLITTGALAQTAKTTCNTIAGVTTCNTNVQPPYQPPQPYPITPVDVGSALRAYEAGRAVARERAEAEPVRNSPIVSSKTPPPVVDTSLLRPTARDLYIGCSLFLDGSELERPVRNGVPLVKSAISCATVADFNIEDSKKGGSGAIRLCLPVYITDPRKEMAAAYVEAFDRLHDKLSNERDGPTLYAAVVSVRWPCPN